VLVQFHTNGKSFAILPGVLGCTYVQVHDAVTQSSFDAIRASFRLDGRVCLVTGGAGHLGSAMSTALAEAGGHVCIVGRNEARAKNLAKKLTDRGLSADAMAADVTIDADLRGLVAEIANRHGRLDVLVNNASAGRRTAIAESQARDYIEAIEIGVAAAAGLVTAANGLFAKAVAANGDASVINIASVHAMVSPDPRIPGASGPNNPPHHGAAKAALLQYTRYAAVHLAPQGIRVNAISPGPFPREEGTAIAQAVAQKVPMGRLGQPGDLAGAIVFLASPAARFVTGANLPVDGGWTAA
jgi:NAD(P)-dependent dehydrogenase (short-subunit alcohol dehydrogenase family)